MTQLLPGVLIIPLLLALIIWILPSWRKPR